jgi:hypothetical protein
LPSQTSAVQSAGIPTNTSMSNAKLKEWIYKEYLERASQPGYKNDDFAKVLVQLKPDKKKKIYQFISM